MNARHLARRLYRKAIGANQTVAPAAALKPTRRHHFVHRGVATEWAILNPADEIQAVQLRDGFYELGELERLRESVGSVATILDVGANVGNHSVYFAQHMGAACVIPVEPSPALTAHLLLNLALNYAGVFDLSLVGRGLGADTRRMTAVSPSRFNAGMTHLIDDPDGAIMVLPGDVALAGRTIDLVKIDVEGMELAVLDGLRATLVRCRPVIFVEVRDDDIMAVEALLGGLGYGELYRSRMYPGCINLLFAHSGSKV